MKEDIKKTYKELYDASTKYISEVDVPELQFIMVDGVGNPTTDEFSLHSKALSLVAHSIRTELKKEDKGAYLIAPLEGLWDTYDNSKFDVTRKKLIKYTLMISQPSWVSQDVFDKIKADLTEKKKDHPFIKDVYLKKWEEGKSVQMLHIGPYNTEITSTKQIMEYIIIQNMKLNGVHHEIYLNNADRVKPEKLKTIVRYPVADEF